MIEFPAKRQRLDDLGWELPVSIEESPLQSSSLQLFTALRTPPLPPPPPPPPPPAPPPPPPVLAQAPPNQSLQLLQAPPAQSLQPLQAPPKQFLQPLQAPPTQSLQPLQVPPTQSLQPLQASPTHSLQHLQPLQAPPTQSLQPLQAPPTQSLQPLQAPLTQSLQPMQAPLKQSLQPLQAPLTQSLQPLQAPAPQSLQPLQTPPVQPLQTLQTQSLQPLQAPPTQSLPPLQAPLTQPLHAPPPQIGPPESPQGAIVTDPLTFGTPTVAPSAFSTPALPSQCLVAPAYGAAPEFTAPASGTAAPAFASAASSWALAFTSVTEGGGLPPLAAPAPRLRPPVLAPPASGVLGAPAGCTEPTMSLSASTQFSTTAAPATGLANPCVLTPPTFAALPLTAPSLGAQPSATPDIAAVSTPLLPAPPMVPSSGLPALTAPPSLAAPTLAAAPPSSESALLRMVEPAASSLVPGATKLMPPGLGGTAVQAPQVTAATEAELAASQLAAASSAVPQGTTATPATGDALSLVVALLAAAGTNSILPSTLTQALSVLQGGVSTQSSMAPIAAPLLGDEDTVQIPNACVGWLKGRQGGMIRDIELRSGAHVEIDQQSKDLGYSYAKISGKPENKKIARGLVIAEVAKVMDQSGSPLDGSFLGYKEEFTIESQYVGWLKGPKGKVIQDLQMKSGTRIEVDQSSPQLGFATVKIFGTADGTTQARALVAHELSKIGPEAAAHVAKGGPCQPSRSENTSGECFSGGGVSSSAVVHAAEPVAPEDMIRIPNSYVGWLKGKQGGMIRDIEGRSGAHIDIDQSTREFGYSTARLRGTMEQKKIARGLVIGEIAKVMDQSGDTLGGDFPGGKQEIRIDGQYIGWLKGPRGKVVQDLQIRSGTRIEVDQSHPQLGFAMVKIFGTFDGIQAARELIAAELSKVSAEAAASILGQVPSSLAELTMAVGQTSTSVSELALAGSVAQQDQNTLRTALLAMARGNQLDIPGLTDDQSLLTTLLAASSGATAVYADAQADAGEVDAVRIPNTCVGWLKGRQGAMIREIEGRSSAQVDIDQSTKELGYSLARIRGAASQRRIAAGLVIAEIAKVMDQSGEHLDESFGGCKLQFNIDGQYVGWLKGPRGKVVQDLQMKSGTRIDVDQSNPHTGFALVKIYGDALGTQQARALIAQELSKVNPEVAAQVSSGNAWSGTAAEAGGVLGTAATAAAGFSGAFGGALGSSLGNLHAALGSIPQMSALSFLLPQNTQLQQLQQLPPVQGQSKVLAVPGLSEASAAPPLVNPQALLQGMASMY